MMDTQSPLCFSPLFSLCPSAKLSTIPTARTADASRLYKCLAGNTSLFTAKQPSVPAYRAKLVERHTAAASFARVSAKCNNGLLRQCSAPALLRRLLLPRPASRRRLRLVAERPRHLLRRGRRVRHNGRRVRLREPVQHGLRHQHGGAQHGALQRRRGLRLLLRAQVRRRSGQLLPGGKHHHHRHQPLPAKLRAAQRRRRLVQPAARALRHGRAGVPPDRHLPRRHRASQLQEGSVREERRDQVHHQRPLLLQPGAGHQRRRRRGRAVSLHQGLQHRLAGHVPQLGAELAEQRGPRRPEPLLQGHHQRRPHHRQQQRRPGRLAVRPDLRRRPVLAS